MVKMVVFDMAGTTVNEDNVVYKTLRTAINEEGFEFSLDQVLLEGAGKEKLQAIKSVLERFADIRDEALATKIFARFLVLLETAYDTMPILAQPNATEVFRELKKRNVVVVLNTGYNRATAESLVHKIGWIIGTDIDGLVTASDVGINRPDPAMILLAMKQFGIEEGNAVVKVGDSIIDIEEGRNAGCTINIGITTGAHTAEQLATGQPEYIIENLIDLLPIVDKANAN